MVVMKSWEQLDNYDVSDGYIIQWRMRILMEKPSSSPWSDWIEGALESGLRMAYSFYADNEK